MGSEHIVEVTCLERYKYFLYELGFLDTSRVKWVKDWVSSVIHKVMYHTLSSFNLETLGCCYGCAGRE